MVIIPSRRDIFCCDLGWELGETGRGDLLRKEDLRKDPGSCLLPILLGLFWRDEGGLEGERMKVDDT